MAAESPPRLPCSLHIPDCPAFISALPRRFIRKISMSRALLCALRTFVGRGR
jgi:hypothetical protein